MTQNRRWSCPNGCTPARLAPERARTDDTRTYCLACSERTGRLVRRVCEAAEKKRAAKAETRAARAKRERAETAEREERERIEGATAVATGHQFKAGYYWINNHTGTISNVPQAGNWDRKKHPPVFAQIAQTIYVAVYVYSYATDIAREAAMLGLCRVDTTSPGLFPFNARKYLDTIERSAEHDRSSVLFNWTALCEALTNDTPLAVLVRDDLCERIRKAHSLLHPIADERSNARPPLFAGTERQ